MEYTVRSRTNFSISVKVEENIAVFRLPSEDGSVDYCFDIHFGDLIELSWLVQNAYKSGKVFAIPHQPLHGLIPIPDVFSNSKDL